jgi:PAS domain S-box-containing protein
MNTRIHSSEILRALRQKAEELVQRKDQPVLRADDLDLQRIAHELEVQYVELELQNEELRRSTRELEASRNAFAELYQSAPVAFVTINQRGIIEQVNTAAARMLAGPQDFLTGRSFYQHILAADHAAYFAYLQKVAAHEDAVPCDLRLIAGDGRLFYVQVHAAARPDQAGGDMVWRLALVDLTGRKQAEQALRDSEVRYRLAASAGKIGAYSRYLQSGQDYWSPEYMAIYGFDPSASLPLKEGIPENVHPQDRPRMLAEALARLDRKTGPDFSSEHRIILPTGEIRWVLIRGRMEFDPQGKPLRSHGIAMDITERRQAEEALKHLNETLEQQVAERTELAETRARQLHYLAVELIEAEERVRWRIAESLHEDLQQILASARMQLQSVHPGLPHEPELENVGRLLAESIGKSRSLSQELSPAILYHSDLGTALQWLARHMGERFDLAVELEIGTRQTIADKPITIFIFRAVQELLFNVVKHARVTRARVVLSDSDEGLSVTVSDEGQGFDPAILDVATSKGGLGLLSLRERTSYVGGHLMIESAPGQGSRFNLTVPLTFNRLEASEDPAAAAQPPRAAKPPVSPQSGEIRVLFADDHKVMRQGLIKLVSGKPGIQVAAEAANGREAVERARQFRPDVVVMDISMPEMDGIEATRRIKAELPGVRVIGLSMHEDEQLARTLREAGAEALINKAASSAELLKAIYGIDREEKG